MNPIPTTLRRASNCDTHFTSSKSNKRKHPDIIDTVPPLIHYRSKCILSRRNYRRELLPLKLSPIVCTVRLSLRAQLHTSGCNQLFLPSAASFMQWPTTPTLWMAGSHNTTSFSIPCSLTGTLPCALSCWGHRSHTWDYLVTWVANDFIKDV